MSRVPARKRRSPRAGRNRPCAAVVSATEEGLPALLRRALESSGFWTLLEQARRAVDRVAGDFSIVILPDLGVFHPGDSTGTDPGAVEALIDILHDAGYSRVAVVGARDEWSLWLENRDVAVLAELIGYHFVTPAGRPYDVVDLAEDLVPVEFAAESVLRGAGLGRAWVEADFRIGFAKNKTDDAEGYALAYRNLLGVLPLRDKERHYRRRLAEPEVLLELHRRAPAQFHLIDAWASNHGSEGSRAAHPLATRTVIASRDALLADWAGSLKMGLDPHVSASVAKGLRELGLPRGYHLEGDLTPYPGWINVPPVLLDAVRRRNAAGVARLVRPWLQSVDRELFPFRDLLNDRANVFARRWLADPDARPSAFWGLVAANHGLGLGGAVLESVRINWRKERLQWKDAALDFDPRAHSRAEYRAVVDYLEPLQRILRETPPEPNGLRWRYLDGSVLFEFSHLTPIRFSDYVARVDIARAVQSMNDYLGGACVPVARDRRGRVVLQAERNIYLPQPNWIAFFGGPYIDVGKLEYVEYRARRQRISWRTIRSSNGSAEFDDGIVTFEAEGKSATRVTIVARQKFTLPLFWQVVNIDLAPKVKNALVVDAYTRYFRRTIANFEAQYQGREFRIGEAANPVAGEEGAEVEEPLAALMTLLSGAGAALQENLGDLPRILDWLGVGIAKRPSAGAAMTVDAEGFRHFPGTPSPDPAPSGEASAGTRRRSLGSLLGEARAGAGTFFAELAEAVGKDLAMASRPTAGVSGAPS